MNDVFNFGCLGYYVDRTERLHLACGCVVRGATYRENMLVERCDEAPHPGPRGKFFGPIVMIVNTFDGFRERASVSILLDRTYYDLYERQARILPAVLAIEKHTQKEIDRYPPFFKRTLAAWLRLEYNLRAEDATEVFNLLRERRLERRLAKQAA